MLSPMSRRRRRQARNVWLAAPVRPLGRQMVGPGLQSWSDQMWRHLTTVGTVAACGFSGVLYKVVTSPTVLELLKGVITRAFHLSF